MRSFACERVPFWCALLAGLPILACAPAHAQEAPEWERGDEAAPEAAPAPAADEEAPPPVGATDDSEDGEQAAGENPLEARADAGVAIAGKIGGGIGQPISEFGGTPVFELELEYLLPFSPPIGRSLGLFLAGQYAQPGFDGKADADPRLPGDGVLHYELDQQQLVLSLGLRYRFDVGSDLLMPHAGIGGRLYMLRTTVKGKVAGESYGENEETDGSVGLLIEGGLDVFVGPGAFLAELQFGWGSLDAYVLRDTSVGALSLLVGYRFVL